MVVRDGDDFSPTVLRHLVAATGLLCRGGGVCRLSHLSLTCLVLSARLLVVSTCYVYPVGVRDPCRGRNCSYGALCTPSLDGLTARCLCPERCDDYGDTIDNGALCLSRLCAVPHLLTVL